SVNDEESRKHPRAPVADVENFRVVHAEVPFQPDGGTGLKSKFMIRTIHAGDVATDQQVDVRWSVLRHRKAEFHRFLCKVDGKLCFSRDVSRSNPGYALHGKKYPAL